MSPKPRNKENMGLPKRWAMKNGAYYYRPKKLELPLFDNKAWFWLGRTYSKALSEYAKRIDFDGELHTLDSVCERYTLKVLMEKAAATQKSQGRSMKRIRAALGENPIQAISSRHIYLYRDAVAEKFGKKTANLDLELLSHLFTKAIEWGAREGHPMTNKQVVKYSLKARDRYVTDKELAIALEQATPFIRRYIALKLLTGVRKGELLSIKLSHITDEGILIERTKGGKDSIFTWTPALEEIIKQIRADKAGKISGQYLFTTRRGSPYIDSERKTSGFDSIWQRFMAKVVKAGVERFTEHDLRAKVASDVDLARAKELLGHADNSMVTEKVYVRRAAKIKPVK